MFAWTLLNDAIYNTIVKNLLRMKRLTSMLWIQVTPVLFDNVDSCRVNQADVATLVLSTWIFVMETHNRQSVDQPDWVEHSVLPWNMKVN